MTTTIITTLVLLAFLAALGAVVMFVYLAGQVGGAVTGAVMQASAGNASEQQAHSERIDKLLQQTGETLAQSQRQQREFDAYQKGLAELQAWQSDSARRRAAPRNT